MAIRMLHGMRGYGIYFAIIEMLREANAYQLPTKSYTIISFDLMEDEKFVKSIIEDYDLFKIDGEMFWSESLKIRMNRLETVREKRRESGRLGGLTKWQANAKQMPSSKVKESKVKEIKEKTTTISPNGEKDASFKTHQKVTDLQRLVLSYKVATGFELEDKAWDKLNFARCSKTGKILLEYFGNWEVAADCVEQVYQKLTSKGFPCTLETVAKHASDWKLEAEKHGILSLSGNGSGKVE